MRKIFLDTSGILASINKRDALHDKAVELNRSLETDNVVFYTTDYIIVEICNALSKRKGLTLQVLDYLYKSPDINIVKITNDIYTEALEVYKNFSDKEWGLTDITSFIVMQHQDIAEGFTGDKHFTQFGFQILL